MRRMRVDGKWLAGGKDIVKTRDAKR
jgi:hypothetical protein